MTITMTRSATTATMPVPVSAGTARGVYVTVNPNGRRSIMDIPGGVPTATALARRSTGGTVRRVALGERITAWLDAEDQNGDGELNWAATHMCAALAARVFTGPDDIPFVCGPALFTTTATDEAAGLSDQQVALLLAAHAAVEHPDTDPVEAADTPDGDR